MSIVQLKHKSLSARLCNFHCNIRWAYLPASEWIAVRHIEKDRWKAFIARISCIFCRCCCSCTPISNWNTTFSSEILKYYSSNWILGSIANWFIPISKLVCFQLNNLSYCLILIQVLMHSMFAFQSQIQIQIPIPMLIQTKREFANYATI